MRYLILGICCYIVIQLATLQGNVSRLHERLHTIEESVK